MIGTIHILLLVVGLLAFIAHLMAQACIVRILRQRYPHQWHIVTASQGDNHRRLHTWVRLQRILRSDIPELFDDSALSRWHRCWRYAPWVAWPAWLGALALRTLLH